MSETAIYVANCDAIIYLCYNDSQQLCWINIELAVLMSSQFNQLDIPEFTSHHRKQT